MIKSFQSKKSVILSKTDKEDGFNFEIDWSCPLRRGSKVWLTRGLKILGRKNIRPNRIAGTSGIIVSNVLEDQTKY
jgi:hypothetical protein